MKFNFIQLEFVVLIWFEINNKQSGVLHSRYVSQRCVKSDHYNPLRSYRFESCNWGFNIVTYPLWSYGFGSYNRGLTLWLIPCGVMDWGPIIEGLTLWLIPCGVIDLGSIIEGFDRQYVTNMFKDTKEQ